jgi:hypothetical protein
VVEQEPARALQQARLQRLSQQSWQRVRLRVQVRRSEWRLQRLSGLRVRQRRPEWRLQHLSWSQVERRQAQRLER